MRRGRERPFPAFFFASLRRLRLLVPGEGWSNTSFAFLRRRLRLRVATLGLLAATWAFACLRRRREPVPGFPAGEGAGRAGGGGGLPSVLLDEPAEETAFTLPAAGAKGAKGATSAVLKVPPASPAVGIGEWTATTGPSGPPAPAASPASSSRTAGAEESPGPPASDGGAGSMASGDGFAPTKSAAMAAPSSASDAAASAMAGGTGGAGRESAPGQPQMATQGQSAGTGLTKPIRSEPRPSKALAGTGDGHTGGVASERPKPISRPSGAQPAHEDDGAPGELTPHFCTRPAASGTVTRAAGRGTTAALTAIHQLHFDHGADPCTVDVFETAHGPFRAAGDAPHDDAAAVNEDHLPRGCGAAAAVDHFRKRLRAKSRED